MTILVHRLFVRALVVHCYELLLNQYNRCLSLLSTLTTIQRNNTATLVDAQSPLSEFVLANQKVWQPALNDHDDKTNNGYVLVEALLDIAPYIVTQLIIGRYIASMECG